MRKVVHFLLLTIYLTPTFISSASAQLVSAATMQQGINPVYFGYSKSLDSLKATDLERLRKAGINQIIIHGNSLTDFNKIVTAFNTNSVLNKFKVILGLISYTHNPSTIAEYTQTGELSQELKTLLDGVVLLAKSNPVVGGYYTFDEPALLQNQFSKEYQIKVYKYIRDHDLDTNARPISLANTLIGVPWSRALATTSKDAQDINFVDQYDDDDSLQKVAYHEWFDAGLTAKPLVIILRAHKDSGEICSPVNTVHLANTISNALTAVFVNNWPVIKGIGFFAYWPVPIPERITFPYTLDNCPDILDEACSYLNSLPTGLKAKWRLDLNSTDSGPQSANATPINFPFFSDQYYVEGNGSMYLEDNNQGLELSPSGGFLKDAFAERSVMFWVQPFSAPLTQMLYEEGDSGNGIAIRIYQGTLQVATANSGSNQIYTVPNFNIPDSTWTHISVVFNHGVLKVYINGEEKFSTNTFSGIGAHWDPAGLGIVRTDAGIGNAFGPNDNTPSFHGFFDDVQLYDIALSAEKVFFTSQALFGQWKWNNSTVNEGSGNTNAILRGGANMLPSVVYEGASALNLNGSQQGAELSGWGGFLRTEIKKRTIMFKMMPTVINKVQMLYEEGDSGNGIAIRLNANNYLEVGVAGNGSNSIYTASSSPVVLNKWYNVAVIFNANIVTVYLDNHKASYVFMYPALNPHWDPAGVGMTITNGGLGNVFGATDNSGSFSGIIDDLKIYNSVISEPYIQALSDISDAIVPLRLAVSRESQPAPTNKKEFLYIYSTSQHLIIKSSELLKSYKLIDVSGRILLTKNNPQAYTVTLDIAHLPEGVYFIQSMNDKGKVSTSKFIR